MRIHRNAKTTPAARAAIVRRTLEEGWSNAATAAAFAVSARTVAKWVQRDRAGGRAARAGRASRPGPAPHQTPARVVTRIKQLRVQHGLPAWAMAHAVGRPRSIVSVRRRRLGLSRPPAPCPRCPSDATRGPSPAIGCMSISSRWLGFVRSAIACTAPAGAPVGVPGGSMRTWRSMTTVAAPMSQAAPIKLAPRAPPA